jgi:hypothetical protein
LYRDDLPVKSHQLTVHVSPGTLGAGGVVAAHRAGTRRAGLVSEEPERREACALLAGLGREIAVLVGRATKPGQLDIQAG